ncbi:MAG: DNA polymerase I [Clostridium sp.]|uniref:DNA polymerase I n=1 Tax=Clostridium sp. TaxID=1506 RepID=UPI003070310E
MSKKTLAILDGNSLLYRGFYAIPELTTKEGVHTNAVYGFLNMLIKLKEDINPDYIVTTFDKSSKTFRHEEYEEYKAGRKKTPPELSMQFPIIREILCKMGISIFELDGYEADDLIGTISVLAEKDNMEVYVVTGDKDALQLATDNVNIVINKKGMSEKEIYNRERFVNDFEVTPKQYIDVKGLMGDKSDNIPGVPGVGEKTAFKLIKEYGSIENVLMNISNISGKKLKESLEEYSEQAIFSKKLATIITEVPVEIPLEQLKTKGSFNNYEVREVCLKLQLKSILSKLQNLDVDTDGGVIQETKREDAKFELIKDCSSLEKIISSIKGDMFVKFYVDNTNSFANISLGTIGILSQGTIYIISCKNLLEESKDRFLISIKSIFENSDVYKISHGVKYGYTSLLKLGVDLDEVDFDLELAAYLLDSSKSEYSIKSIIEEKTGEVISGEGDSFIANEILAMKEIYPILKDKIESSDMNELLFNVEQPLTKAISYMEYEGFNIDRSELDKLGDKFSLEISELTTKIYELAGEEFNVNSPKQLGKILFEKLDLPVIKKTKTGYSTNAEVLDALKDKHEIINKILYFRQITKLYSTYIEGLKHVIDEDGRIHSNFTQTVTTTGRLSSTEPNLQNIPIRSENGRSIRKVFIPHNEESIILSADYSQIELRVLAHISGDENMIKAFNSNIDIHTATASEVFNVPIEEVTKTMRSNAKAVNFGIVYGIGDFSLAQDLGITRIEAKNYIDTYLHRYENVKKYMDMVIDEAEENSYVTTLLNRKRYIPEIKSSNKMIKALGKRLAMNAPIQGSAADIIKIAMVNVAKELKNKGLKSKLILQVHDELILNVYKNEVEQVKELVRNEMEGVLDLKVLLKADISIGDTWYEAK